MKPAASYVPEPRRVALWLGMFIAALGITVLLGWFLDVAVLKSILPGMVTMKANTAAAMLLCGVALALLTRKQATNPVRLAVLVMAVLVIVLGTLTLSEDIFGGNHGIDQLLLREAARGVDSSSPGRMSPSTALAFVLVGTALLVASRRGSLRVRLPMLTALAATVTLIGGMALAGHASIGLLHHHWWNSAGVAVHTATGFVLLGGGLLALVRSEGGLTWSLDMLTTAGFTTGMVSLLVASGVSYHFTSKLQEDTAWVADTQEVLTRIQETAAGMANLESNERRYIILGDVDLLPQREQTKAEIHESLVHLRSLSSDNLHQQRRLDRLEPLIVQRISFEDQVTIARREQGFPAAQKMIAGDTGIELAGKINRVLKEMSGEENDLLIQRQTESKVTATKTFLLMPLGVFVSLAILYAGLFFLNAGTHERLQAEEHLKASFKDIADLQSAMDAHAIVAITDQQGKITYVNDKFCAISKYSREELLGQDHRIINSGHHPSEFMRNMWTTIANGRVWQGEFKNKAKDGSFYWVDATIVPFLNERGKPRQYVAIRADITERKRAEKQVRQLNAELEQRVIERTAQLETANKELEAFSYSVSHDLRSPLRAVDGFSQAVLEDYGAQLPEEGRRQLQTIRRGAQRMGELIDDLLRLSRLGREPLHKQHVETGELVRAVLADLAALQEQRKLKICIGDLPSCECDPSLIKQVWVNVLSNALKYTSKREEAEVEIGCVEQKNEKVYFVRDNGAGFDMRYSGKLFGVFQRLHLAEEYEGTGVGLAIVHQIIHRHGGRVWADAAVDRGATFYFTLGGEAKS